MFESINGHHVMISSIEMESQSAGLAAVAEQVFLVENPDAFFCIFHFNSSGDSLVVARSQKEIIDKVFRECTCELLNVYCGLQCMVGSSRAEILKQHYYFEKEKPKIK